MTNETAAKRDVQKLQRAIVDGLEDVKAQDIRVFNTEHLSSLFERVVVASGTSNRQTRALAGGVVDAVREAGFPKPRLEGQENGEWIIVDCGAAVAHIMQPAIRQYYQLEEIWGDKPIRLKLGAPLPAPPARPKAVSVQEKSTKPALRQRGKAAKPFAPMPASGVKKAAAAEVAPSAPKGKAPVRALSARAAAAKKPAARKVAPPRLAPRKP
jgi:ribosome-associated protein